MCEKLADFVRNVYGGCGAFICENLMQMAKKIKFLTIFQSSLGVFHCCISSVAGKGNKFQLMNTLGSYIRTKTVTPSPYKDYSSALLK
jgi:hypothetical protein